MHRFIARQPILDRYEKVYGYELLSRPGEEEIWPPRNGGPAGEGASRALRLLRGSKRSPTARAPSSNVRAKR